MFVYPKNFRNYCPTYHVKIEVIDKGKYRKWASKSKWKEREYNVQKDDNVSQKFLKMFRDTNQFKSLPICGLY